MTTEDELNAALDRDPGNGFLRLLLADWLDEHAAVNPCERCSGRGLLPSTDGDFNYCDHCSGTGTVSDGRRECAAGYRVLAALRLRPYFHHYTGRWYWSCTVTGRSYSSVLKESWFLLLPGRRNAYPTRREAEDAAALAFGRLPADVQARILAGVTA